MTQGLLKLLVLIFDEQDRDRVEDTLSRHRLGGFTEIPGTIGEGAHGKRFGSALYPGSNTVLLTVVPEEAVLGLRDSLLAIAGEKAVAGSDRIPIRIAVIPVEAFF